jgi:anti-sigma B factor antagonist
MADETSLSTPPVAGVDRQNGAVILHLAGELDLYNTPVLRQVLLDLCAEQPERLVIDLQQVTFVDSTGLGVLIEARAMLRDRGALVLAAPGPDVQRALEISGLDRHIAVRDTVAAAVASRVE